MVDNSQTSLDKEIENWQGYEAPLMNENRPAFSKMLSDAKKYYASFEDGPKVGPSSLLIMTLIFQQQLVINELLEKLSKLGVHSGKLD